MILNGCDIVLDDEKYFSLSGDDAQYNQRQYSLKVEAAFAFKDENLIVKVETTDFQYTLTVAKKHCLLLDLLASLCQEYLSIPVIVQKIRIST